MSCGWLRALCSGGAPLWQNCQQAPLVLNGAEICALHWPHAEERRGWATRRTGSVKAGGSESRLVIVSTLPELASRASGPTPGSAGCLFNKSFLGKNLDF